jgi:non-ribosomal peptide synthetase component F/acyl carrier protein
MVDHRSVVNLLFALDREYPLKRIGTCLLKTPIVFDVSVSELFGWYLGQGRLALLEKDGEKDPYMISGVIERERVTHINFVPSMFQTFVEMLTPRDISKLSSLEYIFLAGEELLSQPVIKFRQFDTGIILENLYGPTEGTVYSSKYGLSAWEGPGSIPIGKPLPNTGLYILDKNGFLQPIGVTGELYIAGTGAARGYLNNPGLTAERFCLRQARCFTGRFLKKLPPWTPRKNFLLKVPGKSIYSHMSYMSHMSYIYKTGDLARWLADGNIEFLGRTDRQVKIRGFRIELGEIENRLLAHRDVKEAAVAVVETRAGDKSLAAYIVTVSPGSGAAAKMEELRAYLPGKLPGYMVPSFFIPLENLPLTASGKVDRKALPEPGAAVHSEGIYTPPRNRIEERLVDLWAEIIGIKKETIGIEADFFKLGGHSLGAVKLIARIHKEINTHIPMNILFKAPTIRDLAGYIKGAVKEVYISTAPVEKKEYYPLSSIQKRLFILDQVGDINTAYNLPHALIVEGEAGIDTQYFQQTFHLLIKRHESLRTSFALIDNEPVQIVHETVDFCISCGEAGESEIHRLIDEFITPFDLNEAPLLRAKLVKLTGKKYLFLYDMHHIISDGTSLGIFLKDFMHLYNREELPGLGVQYKDFSERQNSSHERVRSILKQKEKYWLDRFRGEIPRFDIYTDYPRPSVQSFAGDQVQFTFKKELCQEVRRLRKETDTTLYMVLLSFYNILLARYTGQEDIIIGTPTAGREQVDIENVIGLFMNVLPMRNYPRGNKTFKEFLAEVKQTTIEAYENQGYPFGDLVEKVAVIDDLSRNPIYEAELLVQNMEKPEWKLENLTVTPYEFVYTITQMDIALVVEESEGMIFFNLTYGTALFKRGTIEKMIDSFREIVSVVLDNPLIKLEDIKVSHHFSSLRSSVYQETPMDFEF